jgi:ABC-2 type transport system ATP-binding protein
MAMIEIENLTKAYGPTVAVDDVSFTVERGEILGFLGRNGAGKTTTMRVLTGSLGATRGTARVGGFDIAKKPREAKRLMGYLPEAPPLYRDMTVRAYLGFCARLKRADEPQKSVERVIATVGLDEVAHRLIGRLSKGFRQRVGIAQALVHRPAVLILDEPTSGLDPEQRVEIREIVQELSAGDTTVVLSTHVLAEVEALCDRVVVIHRGRVVAADTIESIAQAARLVIVTVARPSLEVQRRLETLEGVVGVEAREGGTYAIQAGADVREQVAHATVDAGLLSMGAQHSLEDAFLSITRQAEQDA